MLIFSSENNNCVWSIILVIRRFAIEKKENKEFSSLKTISQFIDDAHNSIENNEEISIYFFSRSLSGDHKQKANQTEKICLHFFSNSRPI